MSVQKINWQNYKDDLYWRFCILGEEMRDIRFRKVWFGVCSHVTSIPRFIHLFIYSFIHLFIYSFIHFINLLILLFFWDNLIALSTYSIWTLINLRFNAWKLFLQGVTCPGSKRNLTDPQDRDLCLILRFTKQNIWPLIMFSFFNYQCIYTPGIEEEFNLSVRQRFMLNSEIYKTKYLAPVYFFIHQLSMYHHTRDRRRV